MANWIAVASAEHVLRGKKLGIMQVCHGKKSPLQRLKMDDKVIYYSPTTTFKGKDKLQAFTAMGIVNDDTIYQVDMGNDFCPFRRKVRWFESRVVSIFPLLKQLEFTREQKNWGYRFRYGLFAISQQDTQTIASAMEVTHQLL
ncbi:MAG: EVE domain-containing protein [Gammaproteobacteria bacterium]